MVWKGFPAFPAHLSPGQSSLSAGALLYRAWAQSWSSAALAARSVLPSNRPARSKMLKALGEAPLGEEAPEATVLRPRFFTGTPAAGSRRHENRHF